MVSNSHHERPSDAIADPNRTNIRQQAPKDKQNYVCKTFSLSGFNSFYGVSAGQTRSETGKGGLKAEVQQRVPPMLKYCSVSSHLIKQITDKYYSIYK